MNKTTIVPLIVCFALTCLAAANAQDPFIADAIEQESLSWTSEAFPNGANSGDITPTGENVWHLATDESFVDGDAITVKNPYNLKYFSILETTVGAPIELKFKAMKSPADVGNHLSVSGRSGDNDLVISETVVLEEGWNEINYHIDHQGPVALKWIVENSVDLEAQFWLDNIEILNTAPPQFIEPLRHTELLIPTGTPHRIYDTHIFLAGAFLSYQWFRDENPIPGETNLMIDFPVHLNPGTVQYHLEVTNELGTASSAPIDVEYFDLAEVLDNQSLVFEAGAAGNYAEMPVVGAEAYDGEDAIYLYLPCTRYCTPIYKDTTNSISTELEGPVIVSYFKRGGISLSVNFETPNSEDEVFIDHGEWMQHHVRITEPGSHHLRWAADGGIIGPGNGWIDQVQVDPMTDNTFIHWALSYYSMEEVFTDLESLEVADHNHNGIPNLLEWALNKNLEFPYNTQIPKVVEEDGERYLGITFTRPADLGDYNIYLEGTEDLNDWARILSTTTETYNLSNDTYTVFIRVNQPLSDTKSIIRLGVE